MDKTDVFESLFRSAERVPYAFEQLTFENILVVTDLEPGPAGAFLDQTRRFLAVLGDGVAWTLVTQEDFHTVPELLELVTKEAPDLICSYRHLHTEGWRWPHVLGDHLEVLTQRTDLPVLVLPHPRADDLAFDPERGTDSVMILTDHLTGDHRLVNHGVRFTREGGTLHLVHVEDSVVIDRVMNAIERIPTIDTEGAREAILGQLLKGPKTYIASCRKVLLDRGLSVRVEEIIAVGHRLSEVQSLVGARDVDLLVLNTKDEGQTAMHGLAHPLAVELRGLPLLML